MKILTSSASPYSAKVRMAARYAGLPFEEVATDTASEGSDLVDRNPLGKIPTVQAEDGTVVFDSRAIMQYLDRESGRKLYPRNTAKRTQAEVLEALCDGIMDALILVVYERRFRPEEKVHQEWIDKQWRRVERGLDHLEANLPRTAKNLTGAHFAIAGLLGYLALRFEGKWERGRPKLKNWTTKFEKIFPDYAELKPHVAES
ncbi:glutathione S-transferase family protein [Pararhizobium mangrovi]|uniref:Glutathione S-transferase family protein n=1 Tax=Pararhizobium mangrovi TaxID=2590452 RepID=A0A506UDN8_9HYPH|nr:glutathione S-transferase family protein [Pararhizobium mangrovi]TPW32060.1 glutathione S-transferase family protein [Pararhizobium mangrovi]